MKTPKSAKKEVLHKKTAGKISERKKETFSLWMPLIVILPVTFFVLYPCLSNEFTNWDDPTYILDNPLIKKLNLSNIKRIFTEVYFSNYQPLHILSYALEYRFFEDRAFGYHAVSLFMHLINTYLVFRLASLISGNLIITCISGLLFGIHPMHVESIAWAAERKDLLYAMFFFLSLIFYIRYIQSNEKFSFLLYAFIFFTFSIFSKTMAASLPPVLFLFDYFYKRKLNVRLLAEKIPFFMLALIMGIISVYASKESGSIATNETYTFTDRIFFACNNLLNYFYKLIAPLNLSAYYPYPEKTNGSLALIYYLSPVFCMILLAAIIYSMKFTRVVFLCIGFFVITVFLVLQLLPVGPAVFSERYSYIPSFGFFLLLGTMIEKAVAGRLNLVKILKPAVIGIVGIWCLWLCTVSYQRSMVWKNSITLWDNVIEQFGQALHALNNRADAFYKAGNYALAIKDLDKAILLNKNYAMAWYNRGNAFGQLGKFKEAFHDLDQAIQLDPAYADAYNKRGQANAVLGFKEAAFSDFNKAASLNPANPEIYYNIGITWINNGNKEEACKALAKSVNMNYQPAQKAYAEICK